MVKVVPFLISLVIFIFRQCFSIRSFVRYSQSQKLFVSVLLLSACQNLSRMCSMSFLSIQIQESLISNLFEFKFISIFHHVEVNLNALSSRFLIIMLNH